MHVQVVVSCLPKQCHRDLNVLDVPSPKEQQQQHQEQQQELRQAPKEEILFHNPSLLYLTPLACTSTRFLQLSHCRDSESRLTKEEEEEEGEEEEGE